MTIHGTAAAASGMAATAAIAMVGVGVAVLVAMAAIAAHEQMLLENEMADAQVNAMVKSASDKDIARYYQEYCSTISSKYISIQEKLSKFHYSEETRAALLKQVQASRQDRKDLRDASIEIQPAKNLVQLVSLEKRGLCVPTPEKKAGTPCIKDGTNISALFSKASYKSDSAADLERIAQADKELAKFGKIYSQDRTMDLNTDQILDVLLVQWAESSAKLSSVSFTAVDNLLNLLALKVQTYLNEVQRAKNSLWSKGEKLVGTEEKFQNEFVELRTQYYQLLNKSILVVFGKANAVDTKASFLDFKKHFETFASKVYLNKSVQSLSLSVKSLGDYYETL